MKICFGFLLLFFLTGGGEVHKVARVNSAKASAEKAFKSGNYSDALKTYKILTDSFKLKEETVLINKAHCYFKLNYDSEAKKAYTELAAASDKSIRSIANNQLGLLSSKEKNLDMARNYFKAALKAFPGNEEARYNYELISKLLNNQEKKEEQDKKDQNQNNSEPSEFAKMLKAKAEALSGSYKYEEAYELMVNGVKKRQISVVL